MRRALLAVLVAVTASLVACGDDAKPDRTIAFLRSSAIAERNQAIFLDELAKEGWTAGENLTVLDPDTAEVYEDPDAAGDAVRGWIDDGADLVVAQSTTSAMAAAAATDDVPVLVIANDPVASGIVTNPRAPEDNVTGLSFRVPPDRTIEVARRLVGDGATIGLLWPVDDPAAEPVIGGLTEAASTLGVELVDATFADEREVAGAVGALVDAGATTVIVANAPSSVRAFEAIEAATMAAKLPVVANTDTNDFAVVVLAPDNAETYRQLARQAARLLDGADAREVPLEDPGDFELTIRASIADRLGIVVPADLLEQADALD